MDTACHWTTSPSSLTAAHAPLSYTLAGSGSLHSLHGALGTGISEVMFHAPVHGRSMVARTAREVAANAANRAVLDDRRHNPPPRMTKAGLEAPYAPDYAPYVPPPPWYEALSRAWYEALSRAFCFRGCWRLLGLLAVAGVVAGAREAGVLFTALLHHGMRVRYRQVWSDVGYDNWARRTALVLRGPHLLTAGLRFDCCWENLRENLLDPLRLGGSQVDVFVGTPRSPTLGVLRQVLQPTEVWLMRPDDDSLTVFARCLQKLHAYSTRERVQYDLVVVAQFHMRLKLSVTQLPLVPHAVQFLWGELDSRGSTDGWYRWHRVADGLHFLAGEFVPAMAAALLADRDRRGMRGDPRANASFVYDALSQLVDEKSISFVIKGNCVSDTRVAPNPVYETIGIGWRNAPEEAASKYCPVRRMWQQTHHPPPPPAPGQRLIVDWSMFEMHPPPASPPPPSPPPQPSPPPVAFTDWFKHFSPPSPPSSPPPPKDVLHRGFPRPPKAFKDWFKASPTGPPAPPPPPPPPPLPPSPSPPPRLVIVDFDAHKTHAKLEFTLRPPSPPPHPPPTPPSPPFVSERHQRREARRAERTQEHRPPKPPPFPYNASVYMPEARPPQAPPPQQAHSKWYDLHPPPPPLSPRAPWSRLYKDAYRAIQLNHTRRP